MKTSVNATRNTLPVSKKAYTGFVDRIHKVYASDESRSALMVSILDRYLDGDVDGAAELDDTMRMAFEFLRHDVDLAIERSRRARERARTRRKPSARCMSYNTMSEEEFAELGSRLREFFALNDENILPVDDADSDDNVFSRPLTRRERRARERAARGRTRIKPLGAHAG